MLPGCFKLLRNSFDRAAFSSGLHGREQKAQPETPNDRDTTALHGVKPARELR